MSYTDWSRGHSALVTAAAFVVFVGASGLAYGSVRLAEPAPIKLSLGSAAEVVPAPPGSAYTYRRVTDPNRTEIFGSDGQPVAVMTDGSRTAHLYGPRRTFAEPRFTTAKVHTNVYVRLAPQEWRPGAEQAGWFTEWLDEALADTSPDVLTTAMQYTYGAGAQVDGNGLHFAGDAAFGPLSRTDPDGRAENSDFYDYLGVRWSFPDGKDETPAPTHIRSLDCSGFLRMVYGYRLGYPLRGTNTRGPGLPRRAYAMAQFGPGVQLMPNTGARARQLDRLMPGDLLFFNAGPVQGANIEHSGMYLGVDDRGHHRFISSRSQANGPTMGDLAGESILDGTGYWAQRFRTARRL